MVKNQVVYSIQWKRMLGYDDHEIENSFSGWKNLWHQDDCADIEKSMQDYLEGKTSHYEIIHRLRHKDGGWRWILTRGEIQKDAQGKPCRWVGTNIDITGQRLAEEALKDSEEKYRVVVENALEAVVIAVDGMIKFSNHSGEILTGYAQEELTSRPFTEFIHPDDRGMVIDRHLRRMKGEDIPNIYSFRIVDKAGNNKWVELSAVLITWEGKPAILNFLTDVTDRKRLEEERQRVDKLESVGLLAGGIAHDFNNILTSILGNISLANMEAAPGSELKNSLEQAEKASQRARALTVQLLTFSKGGAPVLKLAPLTELLKDTAGFALSGSKVKCRFSIPAGLWHAEIDAGQVSQVIHNLVINAQQAMPNGGSIEISAENMALSETQSLGRGLPLAAGDYIRIAVADHGCGIPVENLEKIFDPFFTTKQKGNGMGLAVSFSIARQHGGHLSVESEQDTGSTFFLYLPASTQTAVPEQATEGTVKPAGNIRILVMDDEQGVREIAGRLLKHIGYKDIEFAEDGAEAIKLYKAAIKSGNPFTVAILDLTIAGGMGGEIAIQKLLKIDPGVKAIVSSGYIDDPVIAKFKDHGFSGVMGKPYTIEELRKAVQDVIPGPDRLPRPSASQ
jgi:PAS domain S-box-containing protein